MKLGWNPRRLFSPYEIAAAGVQIHLIFFAAAVLLLIIRHSIAAMAIALVISAAGGLIAHWGVTCPGCGKSVMHYYLTAWGERRRGEPFGKRPWPERVCSSCRMRLDIVDNRA